MTKKLKISSSDLVVKAKQRINEISTENLFNEQGSEDLVIVDVRDIRERKHEGYIPNSFHAPRGMIEFWVDPNSPYYKEIFGQDKRFVFYCASGWRSALTVFTLQEMGFEAINLENGFGEWKQKGGQVERVSH